MKHFTFHIVALPHLSVSKNNCFCAFTQKVRNFGRMMTHLGHRVYMYGPQFRDGDEIADDMAEEFVEIVTIEEQDEAYGNPSHRSQLVNVVCDKKHNAMWKLMNTRAIAAIQERQRGFVCATYGTFQQSLQQAGMMTVEYGIGYGGTFAKYRVFESYAHMHGIYGAEQGFNSNGRFYDVVIPNYFDLNDFGYSPKPPATQGLVFLGRMIKRKGLTLVDELARSTDIPITYAGPGAMQNATGIYTDDGLHFQAVQQQYLGPVDVPTRRRLLQNCRALVAPTYYNEPFGGVVVEAQLCGTPVITTDWGAFTETVEQEVSGYRCRTLDQFVCATKLVQKLDRAAIQRKAADRWGMQRVMWQYQEYFEMLDELNRKGWTHIDPTRSELDWLRIQR